MKSVFRQTIDLSTSSDIRMCVFEYISIEGDGAAIHINCDSMSTKISSCLFSENSGTNRGGAICVKACKLVTLCELCFINNYAPYAPSYMMWADSNNLIESYINHTSEYTYRYCDHGSCLGGKNSASHFYNNISHINVNNFQWQITLAKTFRNEFAEFYNCTQKNLIRYYNPTKYKFKKVNVITCNFDSFINYRSESSYEQINSCILFFDTSFEKLYDGSTNYPSFDNCYIKSSDGIQHFEEIEPISDLQRIPLILDYCSMQSNDILVSCHQNFIDSTLVNKYLRLFILFCIE